MKKLSVILCCLLMYSSCAWPEDKQDLSAIHKVALEFLLVKTQGMSGKISIKVDDVDPRISLASCQQLEAFMPTGASILGRTSIGVRCTEKNGWTLFVTASITTTMNMLISSKPLQQGQTISAGDFNIQSGEINQPGIVTDELQIMGKVIKYSIGAGQLLKQDMFRAPYAVTQGETVQLISEGHGFKLRTEGQAMNNASAGQTAQVKVQSGQVISGIAKSSGIVEVRQ